jgi:putative FmdB family regulatory protein
MPFYEYQCKLCGHTLEAMQKISEPALKKCPHCGKPALNRLMSAPVFRLKGAGWYETDFKSDQEGKRNLADRPEAGKDDKPESKEGAAKEGEAAKETGPPKEESKPTEQAGATAAEKIAEKPAPAQPEKSSPARKPAARTGGPARPRKGKTPSGKPPARRKRGG